MDVRGRRSMLLGAGTNWLAFAATLAVSFLLTPYLIRTLGPARYDVWCVAEAVLAYFTLLDMGVAVCLVRSVARHHATGDRDAVNRVASASLAVFLAAGAVAVVVGVPVLLVLAGRLDAKTDDPHVLPFLLLMLANLAATLPLSVFPGVLDGLERFAAKSAVRVGALALRTGGLVAAMEWSPGLLPLAVVYTAANLLEHGVLTGLCFRFLPGLRFARSLVDRDTLRGIFGYSRDAFLAMLAGRITLQTGAIVIGLLLPAGQVTLFVTASRLVEYAKTLLRTITATLTPGVSALEARGDWAGIGRLFLTATRWVLYIVVPVNLGLWYFGRPFLVRWVGPEVGDASFPAAAVLALTLSVGVAQSVASRILYGLGRLRLFARLALAEGALNLLLTAALIRPFGVEGVAWAVAVPNLLFCGLVLAHTLRTLGVSAGDYLWQGWMKPVAAGLVPAAVWALLEGVEPTWAGIAVGIAAGLGPYAVGVAALEFGSAGRSRRAVGSRAGGAGVGSWLPSTPPTNATPTPARPSSPASTNPPIGGSRLPPAGCVGS
ncbi:MAG: oligosaccharide flippase family protein [Gemmataceae bacterium]